MNSFDFSKSLMDVIEIESLNIELNSITYYYQLKDYGRMMDEIYWIKSKYNVEIVTCNEMNSMISDLEFFGTIYKRTVKFLNCKKWKTLSELFQRVFF